MLDLESKVRLVKIDELATILAPILELNKNQLAKELAKDQRIIVLKKDVSRTTAQKIRKLGLREISLGKKNSRVYPQGSMAAHILGYYNPDADVAAGIELTAKDLLEENKHVVKEIAEFLCEKESITGKEFVEIYNRVTRKNEEEVVEVNNIPEEDENV